MGPQGSFPHLYCLSKVTQITGNKFLASDVKEEKQSIGGILQFQASELPKARYLPHVLQFKV